eukprot:5249233-Pyramimonas_sp.AAC.1
MAKVIGDCQRAGYIVKYRRYLASEFGLPQLRPRVYIVGIREGERLVPKLPRGPGAPSPPLSAFLEP